MKNQVKEGNVILVEMLANEKDPTRPICRINGMLGFTHFTDMNYPVAGEMWTVKVVQVKERFVIVMPQKLELTVEQVEAVKWHKTQKLIEKNRPQKRFKREKKVRRFPYHSSQELNEGL